MLARALGLRRAGATVALDGVRVDAASRVVAGANLAHHVELLDSTVGRGASVGRYTKVHHAVIGPYASISWDVTIGATGHPLDRVSTHAFPYRRSLGIVDRDVPLEHPRTVIGPDVWVGAHVVVMPGVTVGAGAVLGAGAVVTRDVAPYAVVAGSPARRLRSRVPEELVPRLLALAWWDWPVDRLRRAAPLFMEPVNESVVARLEALAGG